MSPETYEAKKQEFEKAKKDLINQQKPHPGRSGPYKLSVVAQRDNAKFCQNNKGVLLLE